MAVKDSRPAPASPEGVESLVNSLTDGTGQSAHSDRYPFLLRIGDDWRDYPFNWEPFRDLAGPLGIPEGATPIVLRSEPIESVTVATADQPVPHEVIRIGPDVPVHEIVDAWVGALERRSVLLEKRPNDWFLPNLGLKPEDVSPRVRDFLGVGAETADGASSGLRGVNAGSGTSWPAFSRSVQRVADMFDGIDASAFDIANAFQEKHPEYASNQFGGADLAAPTGSSTRGWHIWRESVAELYDEDVVVSSKHKVIDGRLFLVAMGLLDQSLRAALDSNGAWAPLLIEIDEAAVQPNSDLRGALDAIKLALGYRSDGASGKDELGIEGEVNAVCEVISDPEVKPPLAVGLFGVWGSGKTFFMEKMRERLHGLTNGPDPRRDLNVVQIRFNAWHYSDSSLWASIAVEIFERLLDPEPVDETEHEGWLREHGDAKRAEREKLLGQLETYRESKRALEAERKRLEVEKTSLEQQRGEVEKARKAAVDNAPLTDVAAELAKNNEVQTAMKRIADSLQLTPAVDELNGLASELRTTSGYIANVWRLVEHKTATVAFLATFFVLALATAAFAAAADFAWFRVIASGVGSIAAVVVSAGGFLRPAAQQVNKGLTAVEATIKQAGTVEATLRAKRTKEEVALDLVLADYTEQIAEATRGIAELNDKIAKSAAEAEGLTVGRRLYHFLADRVARYEQYQGIVGMLHRDFRTLDAQLRANAAEDNQKEPDTPTGGLPRIDRVVLYIDDLDRCPPPKVLEVLEAVHLLLALELFIVVVGVDPRWLQRSLRHQYRSLVSSDEPGADPYLQTMPTEYLEKIFQIPLTLAAMEPASYGRLIASLAPRVAAPEPPTSLGRGVTRRPSTYESPGGDRTPTRALLQVQPGSAASGEAGQGIDLTRPEVEFAQQLGGLVETPRGAKRLMNTYRLLRATQHVGSRSRFLGADGQPGDYYAVLSLLAVAAVTPRWPIGCWSPSKRTQRQVASGPGRTS